jgi:hypothetical protein
MYGFNAVAAALVEPALVAPEAAAEELAAEPDALEELLELDEPHAASATQSTSVPMIAVTWRPRGRPPCRESSCG